MHVYSTTPSGLVVAEHGADERQVARALREYDDDLRLIRDFDPDRNVWRWKVMSYRGPDRDAVFVCGWWHDDLTPRPLSMNLVELVKQLDGNTRQTRIDADEHNRRLVESRRREMDADAEAVAGEFAPYLDRGRVSVATDGASRRPSYMRNRKLKGKGVR